MPDFGLFRGFSDKLVAGQTPINLGAIGSTSLVDADSIAFFNRVTAAGGTLTSTEQEAVNALVTQMKTIGIWTSMKAVYPMVGSSSAACSQNLISSSFTGTFTSGWTFSSLGASTVKGAGSFMNTQLSTITQLSNSNTHLSYYNNLAITGDSNIVIGDGVINSCWLGLYQTSNLFYSAIGTNFQSDSLGSTTAFFLTNKTNSTTLKFHKNGNLLSTKTVVSNAFLGAQNLFLNNYDSGGTFSSGARCALASIGNSLTDTQVSDFNIVVQAFQTSLSRQV